jgi:hypothetical protein
MPLSWSRILSSPATLLAATAVFVSSVLWLPIGYLSPSLAGELIFYCGERLQGRGGRTGPQVAEDDITFFQRSGESFAAVPSNQLPARPFDDPSLIYACLWPHPFSRPQGIWAPTESIYIKRIGIDPTGLTADEERSLRRIYVDRLAISHPSIAPDVNTLYFTDIWRSTPIWSGWLHNVISLISFLILITSLPMVTMRLLRECRINKGLCPHCRYSRLGLAAHAPCPECGIQST